jgi:hypothetical protein
VKNKIKKSGTITKGIFLLYTAYKMYLNVKKIHIRSNLFAQWAGHVQRMEGTQIPKKVFNAKFEGVRSVRKPRKRWEDAV